jgi:hypothetical protein
VYADAGDHPRGILAVLVAFFTMSWWMPRSRYRTLLYTGGRPNALSRPLNSASAWIGSLGIVPSLMVSLETKGRRTGRKLRVPVVVAELGHDRYLVSMFGETANRVRNARAANGEAVLRHGIVELIRLDEVRPQSVPLFCASIFDGRPAHGHISIST